MISVTKLINLLDKPALLGWANKIGLEGIRLKDYQSKVKKDGNDRHNEVENYLKNGVEFDGCDKLKNTLEGFDVIGCEIDTNNGFILGRIDIVLKKDNKIYVCDLKRNKYIYLSTKLQLSTYKHIYNGDYICYINSEDLELKVINIDTNKYFDIMKRLYQVYMLITELKERL